MYRLWLLLTTQVYAMLQAASAITMLSMCADGQRWLVKGDLIRRRQMRNRKQIAGAIALFDAVALRMLCWRCWLQSSPALTCAELQFWLKRDVTRNHLLCPRFSRFLFLILQIALQKKRAFKKFSYKGVDLEKLLDLSHQVRLRCIDIKL